MQPYKQHPDIDSAYGFLVALAAGLCHFMTLGFAMAFSSYYVIFLRVFNESKGLTAWVSSINYGMLCGIGPVAGIMIQRYGCRITVFLGGVLAAIGLIASAFAQSVLHLVLTFGLISGTGYGLAFTGCIVVISEYFQRYRVFTMGLSLAGGGLGNIVFPWILGPLLHNYDWRWSLILTGAISLHICAAALLMRPITLGLPGSHARHRDIEKQVTKRLRTQSDVKDPNSNTKTAVMSNEKGPVMDNVKGPGMDNVKGPVMTNVKWPVMDNVKGPVVTHAKGRVVTADNVSECLLYRPAVVQPAAEYSCWADLTSTCGLTLFGRASFWQVCLNTFLYCFSMSVLYTHISSYGVELGLSTHQQNLVLSCLGFSGLLGRLVLGGLALVSCVNTPLLFSACYMIAGVAILFIAVQTTGTGLMVLGAVYGLGAAAYGPLLSETTFMICRQELFSAGYGWVMAFMALGQVTGAPAAGFIYDCTRFYPGSFYLAGCTLVAAGLIILPYAITNCSCYMQRYGESEPTGSGDSQSYIQRYGESEPTGSGDSHCDKVWYGESKPTESGGSQCYKQRYGESKPKDTGNSQYTTGDKLQYRDSEQMGSGETQISSGDKELHSGDSTDKGSSQCSPGDYSQQTQGSENSHQTDSRNSEGTGSESRVTENSQRTVQSDRQRPEVS